MPPATLSKHILEFLSKLELKIRLPKGVNVMNPFRDPATWDLCRQFYTKYFHDNRPRNLILGINPGRFGGGITGIPFTDPRKLQDVCGIINHFPKKTELSADFVYRVIEAYGGPGLFYDRFLVSAVSPLGFTRGGKNLNYYDIPELASRLRPFIVNCVQQQLDFGIRRDIVFCLGEGANYRFLSRLNQEHGFFEHIVPLAHPRFIMQYRRRTMTAYIDDYVSKLRSLSPPA